MADHWTTGVIAYDDNFNVGGYPYGCYAGHAGCALERVASSAQSPLTCGLIPSSL